MPCAHHRRLFGHSWFIANLTVLVTLQTATPVWAWGRLGHRVISRIAERHLTPDAKEAVMALLHEGESLADASTWADEHHRIRGSAPWHYVNIPFDEPKYDARFAGPDAKLGCINDKISEFRAILKDPTKSVEERRFAFRFLVHLVEDLHMPRHVGDNQDRGGNDTQVRWFDYGSNMHKVWDRDMIEWVDKMEDF